VTLLIDVDVLPIALPSAGAADAALPPTPIAAAVNTINTTLRIDNLLCCCLRPYQNICVRTWLHQGKQIQVFARSHERLFSVRARRCT
jgi:hypothetical protein